MDEARLAERRRLLEQGNRAQAEADALDDAGDFQAAIRVRWDEVHPLVDRYSEWLPEVVVARCPFSGEPLRLPIDIVDLDGWFWDYDAPIRRLPTVPVTWLATTGAIRLLEPVTYADFDCEPGPGAPYVVPRILGEPGVVAVISQVMVGRHTGWPVTYFGPMPAHGKLENLWGSDSYPVFDDEGHYRGRGATTPASRHYDFELGPWLESEKLLWIAPGDDVATLRRGQAGCPYLGIEGPHGLALVRKGKVRYSSP